MPCRLNTRCATVVTCITLTDICILMPFDKSDLCILAGDGKCVVCDSYVRPATLVRICDECNYGSYAGRCVICGGVGISDAYYCKECTQQEKDVRSTLVLQIPTIQIL